MTQAAKPKPALMAKAVSNRRTKSGGAGQEPRTLEGRVRKKLQFGRRYQMGCVFTHAEMMVLIATLPDGWLEKECL